MVSIWHVILSLSESGIRTLGKKIFFAIWNWADIQPLILANESPVFAICSLTKHKNR